MTRTAQSAYCADFTPQVWRPDKCSNCSQDAVAHGRAGNSSSAGPRSLPRPAVKSSKRAPITMSGTMAVPGQYHSPPNSNSSLSSRTSMAGGHGQQHHPPPNSSSSPFSHHTTHLSVSSNASPNSNSLSRKAMRASPQTKSPPSHNSSVSSFSLSASSHSNTQTTSHSHPQRRRSFGSPMLAQSSFGSSSRANANASGATATNNRMSSASASASEDARHRALSSGSSSSSASLSSQHSLTNSGKFPSASDVLISRPDKDFEAKKASDWTQTFSNKLLHHFDAVNTQAGAGLVSMKRSIRFMERITKLERDYAHNVRKLAEQEIEAFHELDHPDRMSTVANANIEVFKRFVDIAEAHSRFGAELEQNLTVPLESCYEACNEARKSAERQEREASDQMAKAESTMNRSRLKAMKILNGVEDGQHLKNSMLDMTRKIRGKHKRTALEACTRYNEDLNHANFIQKTYLSYDMPACLSELQAMEELRIEATKRNLSKFTENHRNLMAALSEKDKEIDEVITRIDAKKDLNDYTENTLHTHGAAQAVRPFSYDLPRSLESLHLDQQAQATAQVDGGSLFGGELTDIMKMSPNQGCTVPRIITSLCEALETSGGFEKEGIFRLSASTADQTALKNQVSAHNYAIPTDANPHAIASTIKVFLRELKSPLFPDKLYQRCLRLGLKAKEDPELASKDQRFDEMFSQVPPANRATIEYLVRFLSEVAKSAKVNRMGIPNLAIIFAPSMLRDPSGDPMSMMRNTQYESGFVIYLIETLSARLPPWSNGDGGGGGQPPVNTAGAGGGPQAVPNTTASGLPPHVQAHANGVKSPGGGPPRSSVSVSMAAKPSVGGGLPIPTTNGGLPKPSSLRGVPSGFNGSPPPVPKRTPSSLPRPKSNAGSTGGGLSPGGADRRSFGHMRSAAASQPPRGVSSLSMSQTSFPGSLGGRGGSRPSAATTPPAANSSTPRWATSTRSLPLPSSIGGGSSGSLGSPSPSRRPNSRGPPPPPPSASAGVNRPISMSAAPTPLPTAMYQQQQSPKNVSGLQSQKGFSGLPPPKGVSGLPPVPTRKPVHRRQSRGRAPPPFPPGGGATQHATLAQKFEAAARANQQHM